MPQGLFDGFVTPRSITPDELREITNGLANPAEDIKNGAWQAFGNIKGSAKKLFEGFRDVPPILIKRGLGLLITPPDVLIEKEEKEKKRKKDPFTALNH
jgi:hypothetical protein